MYGRIGRQKMLAEIYKECGSIFWGGNTTMTDKQILGGRGSAKPYTTLNTIEVMLENEKLKSELKAKEQECEELKDLNTRLDNQRETYWKEYQKLKQTLTEIKEIAYELTNKEYTDFIESKQEQILQKCEVLDE